jgi:hypothetical protein
MDFLEMASASSGIDYKFLTKIEILDGGNGATTPVVLEAWDLYGCYIKGANYGDLNYGTNVVAPKVKRDFRIEEESKLTMSDVSILISQVGYRPTKEWIETTYKVELEEGEDTAAAEETMPPLEEPAVEGETSETKRMSDEDLDTEISKLEDQLQEPSEEPENPDDDAELEQLLSDLESPTEEDEDDELNKLITELESST